MIPSATSLSFSKAELGRGQYERTEEWKAHASEMNSGAKRTREQRARIHAGHCANRKLEPERWYRFYLRYLRRLEILEGPAEAEEENEDA